MGRVAQKKSLIWFTMEGCCVISDTVLYSSRSVYWCIILDINEFRSLWIYMFIDIYVYRYIFVFLCKKKKKILNKVIWWVQQWLPSPAQDSQMKSPFQSSQNKSFLSPFQSTENRIFLSSFQSTQDNLIVRTKKLSIILKIHINTHDVGHFCNCIPKNNTSFMSAPVVHTYPGIYLGVTHYLEM